MQDTQVANLIAAEIKRQQLGIEMIPSENYVSPDVLKALGSVFTNKYSEGYPGRRYYGGQENTNQIERWRLTALKNYSALITPMSSRTPAPRPTRRYIMHGVSQTIPF